MTLLAMKLVAMTLLVPKLLMLELLVLRLLVLELLVLKFWYWYPEQRGVEGPIVLSLDSKNSESCGSGS